MAGKSITDDPIEIIRTQMMFTARRYASHGWEADKDKHIRHDDKVDTPDRHTWDEEKKIFQANWSEWHGWADGGNCGVPYFWGGDAALNRGLDFLQPGELTFGEVLERGIGDPPKYDAGDISTVVDSIDRWKSASGVDCSGFVSQVWRLGEKYNSGQLKDLSRPIRFEDLEAGDLLYMKPLGGIGHVMLFKEFLTAERATPGVTRIKAYESAVYNARVGIAEYELVKLEEPEPEMKRWNGIEDISSDKVTLKRIATYYGNYPLCGEDRLIRIDLTALTSEERFANGYLGPDAFIFYPRTYITPADIVLVIDRSDSMNERNKIGKAKEAAKLFVDLMSPGGKIGVVAFNDTITLAYQLTSIDLQGRVKGYAKDAIDALVASGFTSIGGGLQLGHQELITKGVNAHGKADPLRIIVLLSDGRENRTPFVTDELLKNIKADNIIVLSVALGSDANQDLLKHIAEQTRGIYRFAPSGDELQSIFYEILGRVYGENVVWTASGTVPSEGTVEEKVLVDSTIGSMTFSLFWRGSDLDLTLVQPDGSIIDPSVAETNPNVSFTSGGTYKFYKIYNPQAGEWTMRILGKSTPAGGETYSISVSAMNAMDTSIEFDKAEYFAGDPIKIKGRIEDTVIDFAEPNYVLGAAMKVTVEDPALNHYTFDLHDDGLHGDGEPNDGVYANTFTSTALIGSYNFKVQVSGINNRDGQPFTREYAFSHVLKDSTLRFPNTPVLDDFNRKKGKLGSSWSGARSGYRIVDQQVDVRHGGPIYWKSGILGSDQQAFITLVRVDPDGVHQGLLLKIQDTAKNRGSWRKGAIAIFYLADEGKVGIKTYVPRQRWKTLAMFDATLQDGDQLGGRAEADGTVRAFVNGVEIGSVDAGGFFVGKGGRIGMWFKNAADAVLDDFGGGGAITILVMQGTDDAGPEPSVCHYRTDHNEIYFGHCMDGSPIVSGFRFQNVLLPAHAAIVEAHLEFIVDGTYANEVAVQFFGERSKNAATFTEADRPSDRRLTAASVSWAIPASDVWRVGQKRRTPDLTAIVQELVNLPGWANGNAMAIIVQADPGIPGDVHRRVFAWERQEQNSAPARLVVIYTIGSTLTR